MVAGDQHAAEIAWDFFKPDNLGVFVDHARRNLRHGYGKRSLQFEGKVLAFFKISVRDIPVLRRRKHGSPSSTLL